MLKGLPMKAIDGLKESGRRENDRLVQNAKAVDDANRRMFVLVLVIGTVTFAAVWLLTFLVDSFAVFRTTDIVLILAFLALFGLSKLPVYKAPAVVWLYCTFLIYAVVTIFSGVFVTQDYVDVMTFVCLFQLPVLTLDRSWRVDLCEIALALAYVLIVVPHKAAGIAKIEIVNVFFFTASALAVGGFLRRTRIDNFELERQGSLRETTDYLTGLYNRRKLFSIFSEKEKEGCEEPITGMLMLDIDNFKLFNDSYGHIVGDNCLQKIGAYFLRLSENYPICFFRYGGEEFLGTSCTLSREELFRFCEKMVRDVRDMNIPNKAVEKGRVTISVGITSVDAENCGKYELMISEADYALYAAKRSGRDRVVAFTSGEEVFAPDEDCDI